MDEIRGSVFGFTIGDAMGVPAKFKERDELLQNPVISMTGYGTFNVPSGTFSGNTVLTLESMNSIADLKDINYNDMMTRFCKLAANGEYASIFKAIDIDVTIKKSMLKFLKTESDAVKCGSDDINANGNGSIMRMLPIALYCHYNKFKDYEVFNIVKNASSMTHANEISILGCYIYVNYLLFILNGKDKFASYNMIKCLDYSEYFDEDTVAYYNRLLKTNINNLRIDDLKSTGYVVYTLEAAIWVILNTNSFSEAIVGAINLGGDTNAVGAITGSIAGIIYGYDNIPQKWLLELKKANYIEEIILKFEDYLS